MDLLLLQIFFLRCCLSSHFFSERARLFTISELVSVTRISALHHDTSPMSQPFLCTSRCYQWVAPPTRQLPAPCLLLCRSPWCCRTIRKYNSETIVFFIPDTKPPFHPGLPVPLLRHVRQSLRILASSVSPHLSLAFLCQNPIRPPRSRANAAASRQPASPTGYS